MRALQRLLALREPKPGGCTLWHKKTQLLCIPAPRRWALFTRSDTHADRKYPVKYLLSRHKFTLLLMCSYDFLKLNPTTHHASSHLSGQERRPRNTHHPPRLRRAGRVRAALLRTHLPSARTCPTHAPARRTRARGAERRARAQRLPVRPGRTRTGPTRAARRRQGDIACHFPGAASPSKSLIHFQNPNV